MSFQSFTDWYNVYAESYWEPARRTIQRVLNDLLDDALEDRERDRIRVHEGRLKSPYRLWLKAQRDKYWPDINQLDDVVLAIDDIVGTRLICLTVGDVHRAIDALGQLPLYELDGDNHLPLYRSPDTDRDYMDDVKPSGYRAYHLNLIVNVQHYRQFVPVECEVQIRTLLQDSWGELTHEDTYKQGAPMPAILSSMSRVMADMLAAIDGLADEIACEIERLEHEQDALAALSPSDAPEAPKPDPEADEPLHEAVAAFLRDRWQGIESPLSLAALADELRRQFGQEVGKDWLGYGFKALVQQALPSARLNPAPPGFLLPPAATSTSIAPPSLSTEPPTAEGIPGFVRAIRVSDQNYPALSTTDLDHIFAYLERALSETPVEGQVDVRHINLITRKARDAAAEDGHRVGRNAFNYVAMVLYLDGSLEGRIRSPSGGLEITSGEIRRHFFERTLALLGGAEDEEHPFDTEAILTWVGLDR